MNKRPPVDKLQADFTTAVEYNKLMLESLRIKNEKIRAMRRRLNQILTLSSPELLAQKASQQCYLEAENQTDTTRPDSELPRRF